MNHLGYLWAATAVVWGATLLYVWTLIGRQNRLQRELDAMKRTLEGMSNQRT